MDTSFVFVHGLFGWGESDPVYRLFPQWGMGSGNVLKDLRAQGYRCCAPALGPISSAWDRACELYAQLTGTRTDYGAAHAARHGHARYGRNYDAPLAPDWSAEHPVHLIGHSFGGATSRLLLHLLAQGNDQETAACGDPSPLFAGGKADWVKSLTCIASPHNGSTFGNALADSVRTVAKLNLPVAAGVRRLSKDGQYDFKLDQFAISAIPDEGFLEAVDRRVEATLAQQDSAFLDLSVDGAIALNERISMPEGVWYFSEPCCRTTPAADGSHRPDTTMTPLLRKSAKCIGAYYDQTSPGGVLITRDWCPNDGMVNTISALHPMGAPHAEAAADAADFARGVWNVMPVHAADHLEIQGGFGHPLRTRKFYRSLIQRLGTLE